METSGRIADYIVSQPKTTKFVHLIIVKIIRIVATRCQILKLKCIKFDPTPALGPSGLANSALRASHFGPSGLTSSVRAWKLFTFISPSVVRPLRQRRCTSGSPLSMDTEMADA